ncbi:hypothetical protein B5M09_012936 [Aphanomyces astaci]|uniref:Uncharacterized protein n=1 Tax=Aphanomyces astaci TaxID=112090 RepID=A0A425DGY3_APHAT|nr:hypothetical protein B5M09_012936 [Aphanomyces astaci]
MVSLPKVDDVDIGSVGCFASDGDDITLGDSTSPSSANSVAGEMRDVVLGSPPLSLRMKIDLTLDINDV